MSPAPVAVFAMTERGHFQRLLPLIGGLSGRGVPVHVFTDERFRSEAEAAGAEFVDLFARYPLEPADGESVPFPCRFVSHAAEYAEQMQADLEAIGASLVIYDTFAVIGRVAALALGLPHVNVCAGHNMDPSVFVPMLREDPRVSLAPACLAAVETLRKRHGIGNASPFSYVDGISPHLNVYCEPPEFLTPEERHAFEPIAFQGSLTEIGELAAPGRDRPADLRVYISFGSVVWRYWAAEALTALRAISEALARRADVTAIVSLGGAKPGDDAVRAIEAPNVSIERWVDQREVLRGADVFISHQGLNSTHEAIDALVPMISYPFFSDQPALAARCRELGLAVPLGDSPRAGIAAADVEAALQELLRSRPRIEARLTEAREWERNVIASRPEVLDRVIALAHA